MEKPKIIVTNVGNVSVKLFEIVYKDAIEKDEKMQALIHQFQNLSGASLLTAMNYDENIINALIANNPDSQKIIKAIKDRSDIIQQAVIDQITYTIQQYYPLNNVLKGSDPTLFECGPGWHPMIIEALKKIKDISDEKGLNIEVSQVKEKFGGLRIYLSNYTDKIEQIVQAVEDKSFTICENCGRPGSLKTNMDGWYVTRCEKCFHEGLFELEEKRKEEDHGRNTEI